MAPKSILPFCRGLVAGARSQSYFRQKCAEALQRSGYQVTQIDVDRDLAARLTELAPMFVSMRFTGLAARMARCRVCWKSWPFLHTFRRARFGAGNGQAFVEKDFADAGLPVAPSLLIMRGSCTDHPLDPPYVVKPVNQGSSVGVQIVPEGANELPNTLTVRGGDMITPPWSKPILRSRIDLRRT